MNEIKHVGILGMRWGHKKSPQEVLKERDQKWSKKVPSHFLKAYNNAADRQNNGQIKEFNNRPEYKDKNFKDPKNKELFKKYVADYEAMFLKTLNEEMNKVAGPSPSGTKVVEVVPTANGYDFYIKDKTP